MSEAAKTISSRPAIYIETAGCAFNFSDSEAMAGVLRRSGYELAANADEAEVRFADGRRLLHRELQVEDQQPLAAILREEAHRAAFIEKRPASAVAPGVFDLDDRLIVGVLVALNPLVDDVPFGDVVPEAGRGRVLVVQAADDVVRDPDRVVMRVTVRIAGMS